LKYLCFCVKCVWFLFFFLNIILMKNKNMLTYVNVFLFFKMSIHLNYRKLLGKSEKDPTKIMSSRFLKIILNRNKNVRKSEILILILPYLWIKHTQNIMLHRKLKIINFAIILVNSICLYVFSQLYMTVWLFPKQCFSK